MRRSSLLSLVAVPVFWAAASCGPRENNGDEAKSSTGVEASINAAGATFPATIYQRWGEEFQGAHINYQSVGSGAGINQLMQGTVDFGASDMPMTEQQMAKMGIKALHFPTVLGAVVPAYNIAGISQSLNFTPDTLAGIYLGTIKKWNDAKLKADNTDVHLPDADIIPVHRSDGSGTTFVWCDYLAKVSPAWKNKIGGACATSLSWPAAGLAGKGNEGVAGIVKQTPNAIGYLELVYASKEHMTFGQVRNKSGKFVKPSVESVTAAAAGAASDIPADFRVSITDAPGDDAYPISSFTYLLVPSKIPDATKKKAITDFLNWMLTTGQKDAPALDFAPLPAALVTREQQQIAQIQ